MDPIDKDKDTILRSIEWIVEDLVNELATANANKLKLRICEDEAHHQLHYTKRTLKKMIINIKTLSQIYQLIISDQKSTMRDLYYDHKHLYKKQETLTRSISDICSLLNTTRSSLNLLSCSKGILMGSLCLSRPSKDKENAPIDCSIQPLLISESFLNCIPSSSAKFILVVEKDATFQKLIDDEFHIIYPFSILVTGKGYPDLVTRQFLRHLTDKLNIPIFGLFDADPHGIEIFLTYKYGSSKNKAEGYGASVPCIQWLGLRPSERDILPIASNQLLPLNHLDYRKTVKVRRRAETLKETDIVREIDSLRDRRCKMELEAVSSAGIAFLPRFYLSPRIRNLLLNE